MRTTAQHIAYVTRNEDGQPELRDFFDEKIRSFSDSEGYPLFIKVGGIEYVAFIPTDISQQEAADRLQRYIGTHPRHIGRLKLLSAVMAKDEPDEDEAEPPVVVTENVETRKVAARRRKGAAARRKSAAHNGGKKNAESPELTIKVDYERVNHPSHYNNNPSGIECIDVVEHMNFNLGNAVKYVWRAGFKPGSTSIEDLKKAKWYLEREISRLGKGKDDDRNAVHSH